MRWTGGVASAACFDAHVCPCLARACPAVLAWLCGGVGTVVGGQWCEAGVVGNGCAGVVLVGCDVGQYAKNDPHCGGDA